MRFYVSLAVLSLAYTIITAAPLSSEEDLEDVGEYGKYFEGDMVLTREQREAIKAAMDSSDDSRNGLRDVAKRWPNKTVVYYIVDDDFEQQHLALIEEALADIASKSCIKFRERRNEEEHAVRIQGSKNGCYSNVGHITPDDEEEVDQVLNLARGCFKHGTVVHEMLHTLGFYHMQSTYDRDDFVNIVWENISPGTEHNFAKYNNDTVTDFGVPYDYQSVMHYSEKAFSKNGNKTIVPVQENVKIGQRDGLSESDIMKLHKMYCEESGTEEVAPPNKNGQDKEIIVDGSDKGCFSTVGYNGQGSGRQVLNLATGCFRKGFGTTIHEMLHTLGFYHMQSNYNRDDYVIIVWENIRPDMGRLKLSVVLIVICAVKCLAMSYSELEDFSDYIKKTSQLSPTLKKGVDPDDYDEEENVSDHAWEESGKFEGDLILNERQRRLIVEDVAEGLARNGIRDGAKRWPNNEVIVYIQVEHFTNDQVQAILSGIDEIARASCVKFRRYRKGDKDAVVIQGNRRGCFSQVGYQGGYQVLNLSGRHPVGRGCFRHGTVVHEMLHTLGFYHMQSSPDRDDYVNIVWENIVQPAKHNFRKYNSFSVSDFGVGYDYDSVLHYSRRAFSSNGQDTIVPKQRGAQIGQRLGLSDKDTQKLNKMYCDADSDILSDDNNTKKNKKKSTKNKPFDGHGIGYHQGKAVVIKLLPAAETQKLTEVPTTHHVFDHFSKTPQVLSTTQDEGFRVGKEITYSFIPSEPLKIGGNTAPADYNPGPKTQSYEEEPEFHLYHDDESEVNDKTHGNLKKPSEVENDDDSTLTEFRNTQDNKQNPALIEEIDRLAKIIKSHVYPSQTPDFSIYKMFDHSPPEDKKEEVELMPRPARIINPISQKEKTESAVHQINNLYNLNSHEAFRVLDDQHHPKPNTKDYHEGVSKVKESLLAAIPAQRDPSYKSPFFEHDEYDSGYTTSSPFATLERYPGDDEYAKYSSSIPDDGKSRKNQDEWLHKYTPYKYKDNKQESEPYTGFVKHNSEEEDYDYSSPKQKEYSYHAPYRSEKFNDLSNEEDR
ncbi:uncharacterized protein LOC142986323 [Anticarsia gemmatalis]|uniref:uncharacterized protein LOC142986323 n=1 Tax=Anticarsia gemmatalis TaxID=129554 RepID=UPI003F75A485